MKKNETEESYKLTVKGLVFSVLRDHEQTSQVIDAMELYMQSVTETLPRQTSLFTGYCAKPLHELFRVCNASKGLNITL